MPSADLLDFQRLTMPISGPNPAGADPRAESGPGSLYYRIKDARTTARAAERRLLLAEPDAELPDWKPVLRHGIEALAEKTKDLEIVAYVIEALVRLHGFAGLRDGFRLGRELVERFWDSLYPLPDEDGLETRVAPLTGLNGDDAEGTLPAPINNVPIAEGPTGRLACSHYLEARAFAKIADAGAREKKLAAGATTPEVFQKAVAETPAAYYRVLVEDLIHCQEEFARLSAALEQRCGPQHTPPTSNIRNVLAACLDVIKDAARDKLQAAAVNGQASDATASAVATPGAAEPPAPPKQGRTREDAFREILDLAEFFRRTEPQAILSFALEQVVRWGQLSLPELLSELIPEEGPRKGLFKQVGIRIEPKAEAAKK